MTTQPEIVLYRRVRKSPYFHAAARHGVAAYSVTNAQYHPRRYRDPFEEYEALVNDVTLWDVGSERQVEITGPDALAFVDMLTFRDFTTCEVGQCKYALITLPDGGILSDPIVLRLAEDHFWLSTAETPLLSWCQALAYWSEMDVQVRKADVGPVQVQGPKSLDVMVDLFGESLRELKRYWLTRKELDGMSVVISRTGFTNELGYEIYLEDASKNADRFWQKVWEAGQPYGMQVTGPIHVRRIEAGILSYDADMNTDTNPFEVAHAYPWPSEVDKAAFYMGKEALQRIRDAGVERKLVGVKIDGASLGAYIDGSMPEPFPVVRDGREVGQVTSACYSPQVGTNVGLAMLPTELTAVDTPIEVETPYGRRNATVAQVPFVESRASTAQAQVAE